jgi:predicted ATP-grasp superfamily ATP-dependent carboligase
MQKKILCIGAGNSQVLVIRKAQQLGYNVIAVDWNEDSPGFNLADDYLVASTHDADAILDVLDERHLGNDIHGILNRSSGIPVITVAKIACSMGIPQYDVASAETVVHKNKLMVHCKINGIRVPRSIVLNNKELYATSVKEYPIIIKPTLSNVGKSGVFIIQDEQAFLKHFDESQSMSLDGNVNIDEYVHGNDTSILGFVKNGKLFFSVLVDEINGSDANGLHYGRGFSIPSIYTDTFVENEIKAIAAKLVKSLKIDTSPLNISFRVNESGQPFLIEIHLEIGGDLVWDVLIPEATESDPLRHAIEGMFGDEQEPANFNFNPTAIAYSSGEEIITSNPYKIIKDADVNHLRDLVYQNARVQ